MVPSLPKKTTFLVRCVCASFPQVIAIDIKQPLCTLSQFFSRYLPLTCQAFRHIYLYVDMVTPPPSVFPLRFDPPLKIQFYRLGVWMHEQQNDSGVTASRHVNTPGEFCYHIYI